MKAESGKGKDVIVVGRQGVFVCRRKDVIVVGRQAVFVGRKAKRNYENGKRKLTERDRGRKQG